MESGVWPAPRTSPADYWPSKFPKMVSTAWTAAELRDCRRYARAVISASFISSLRHVQGLKALDESVEGIRRKLLRSKLDDNKNASSETTQAAAPADASIKVVALPKEHRQKTLEQPVRPRNWSPITDGKKAISAMIDQVWSVPYAPCQYVVQFICTVSLYNLQRHKYCVRWQNGRRSAMFFVNIDETKWAVSVWVTFPGEMSAHRPLSSAANFHRFLQRNLF